jgi:hypothetical protein
VLQTVSEIIHEIDLSDGMYPRAEASGIGAVLRGWQLIELPDSEMEARAIALFEGLYVALDGNTRS